VLDGLHRNLPIGPRPSNPITPLQIFFLNARSTFHSTAFFFLRAKRPGGKGALVASRSECAHTTGFLMRTQAMAGLKVLSWLRQFSVRSGRIKPQKRLLVTRPRLELLEDRLTPNNHTWITTATDGLWSDPTNWDSNGPPVPGEQNINLFFGPGAVATDDLQDLPINSITFTGSQAQLKGEVGFLRILGGIFDNGGNNHIQSSLNLAIGSPSGVNPGPIEFLEGTSGILLIDGMLFYGSSSTRLVINGTVELTAANQYTGYIDVEPNATLELGNDAALGNAFLEFDGGTVTSVGGSRTISNAVIMAGGGTIAGTNAVILNGNIDSGGTLTLAASPSTTVTLNGPNTYFGGTIVSGCRVFAGSNSAFGTGPVTLDNALITGPTGLALDNPVVLSGIDLLQTTTAFSMNGPISGSGALQEFGGGTLTLSAASTCTGTVAAAAGTLAIGNNSALGTAQLVMADSTSLQAPAPGSGLSDVILANALQLDGNVVTMGASLSLTGNITGSGSLFDANSELILVGDNSYQGSTNIDAGSLDAESATALPSKTALTISQGATLGIVFVNLDIGSLAGSGEILVNGGPTLTVGHDDTSTTFSGTITGPFGFTIPLSLDKVGSGTLTFSGSGNYSGPTTVQGGLVVDGRLVGPVVITSSGSLSGTGTVGGIEALGDVEPGDQQSPGVLTDSGSAVFSANTFLTIPINGQNQNSELVGGSVDLTAQPILGLVSPTFDFSPSIGTSFTVISANSVTGTFLDLPEGAQFVAYNVLFAIHYTANSVTVTEIGFPAPSITGFSSVTEGDPAGNLTITGTGFIPVYTTVTLDGQAVESFVISATQLQVSIPSYPEEGTHTVALTNPAPGGGTITSTFNVADAPLSANGSSLSATEGLTATAVVANFSDPVPEDASTYTAFISWGDGNTTLGVVKVSLGAFVVIGSHAYVIAGGYNITTTIQDEGGASTSAQGPATVGDAPLSGFSRAPAFTEGVVNASTTVLASFTDVDPLSFSAQYAATVSWGDQTTSAGTVVPDGSGFDVIGSHAYAEEGQYPLSVNVTDDAGATVTINSTATVADAPLAVLAGSPHLIAGAPFKGVLATFTDPDANAALQDYSATISWGNGATSPGIISTNPLGGFTVSGRMTYANAGAYVAQVTVTDVGGATNSILVSVPVVNVGTGVVQGQSAPLSFWASQRGQSLIDKLNGGSTSTALSTWLVHTLPNLYGSGAGSHSLVGLTNEQLAAFYLNVFAEPGPKLDAAILDTALDVYATTASLGGQTAAAYGFKVNAYGLGASLYNVGSDGKAFAAPNGTDLTVFRLLKEVNRRAGNGVPYGGNTLLENEALTVLNGIDAVGKV
jgi:autotransporter-associated beta strand protein